MLLNRFSSYMIMMMLLVVVALGCEKEVVTQVDEREVLYEENELDLPVDFEIVDMKKIEADRFIMAYRHMEDEVTHRLAYTNSTFTEIIPILNDVGSFVHFGNIMNMEEPYEVDSIGMRLLFDIDSEGNIYALHYETAEIDDRLYPIGTKKIYKYDDNGVLLEKITVKGSISQSYSIPPNFILVEDELIVIVSETGITTVDMTGELVSEISVEMGIVTVDPISKDEREIAVGRIIDVDLLDKDKIVFIQEKRNSRYLTAYDLSDQQILWEQELDEEFIPVSVTFDLEKNQIFVASSSKTIAFQTNGTAAGEVIDFNDYAVGAYLSQIFNGADALRPIQTLFHDGKMYVYFRSLGKDKVEKIITFRPLSARETEERLEAIAEENANKTTVTIMVPYVESTMEQKIAQYERLNPDVKIQLLYFSKDHEEFNAEDYLQFVNMQVLANNVEWDIMSTQLLPYDHYIKKGYFADLEQIESTDWEKEKERFFTNLLEAIKVDGKLRMLPARIAMHVNLAAMEESVELESNQYTWTDLIEIAEQQKQANEDVLIWGFPMFGYAYDEVSNSYQIDILATQNEPEVQAEIISEFLETLKFVSTSDDRANRTENTPLFMHTLFFPSQFHYWVDRVGTERRLLPSPRSPISGKSIFTIQEAYAINSNSENQKEALQFMLFLARYAEPNNILFKDSFQELRSRLFAPTLNGSVEQREAAIEALQEIVENLNAVHLLDFRITDAIYTTAEQYVNDIVDLETAVKTIQEKLWLYSNE